MHLKLLSPEAFLALNAPNSTYRLAAGLRLDLLGSLQRSHAPSCIKGCLLLREGRGEEKGGRGGEEGVRREGWNMRHSLALGGWTPLGIRNATVRIRPGLCMLFTV